MATAPEKRARTDGSLGRSQPLPGRLSWELISQHYSRTSVMLLAVSDPVGPWFLITFTVSLKCFGMFLFRQRRTCSSNFSD